LEEIMDLWTMTARALGERIRDGETSSQDAVQAHLRRIGEVNPAVNAVVDVRAERALADAAHADAEIAAGRHRGPLHGVPFTVKANIDVEGGATTQGVIALAGAISSTDSPQVARMRAAGAIPIGRTNMPDYGFRWHTDNALYGATVNPWDPTRTPGGSGGGDAVAVATGCAPIALGNDYGGSLRGPAQANGVASLRASVGRIPYANATSPVELPLTIQLFASQGVMARSTADLRTAFGIMAGADSRDPWSVPIPATGPATPRRVAVTIDPAGRGVDTDVVDGVRRAADALADAGYDVEEIEPPLIDAAAAMWLALVATDARLNPQQWRDSMSEQEQRFVDAFLDIAPLLDLGGYAWNLADRQRITRQWALFQDQYPIVLGPVTTRQPFAVGADLTGPSGVAEIVDAARLMVAVNLLGLPAAVCPVGAASGLPQAVQLIGPRYREDTCLDAAQAIEDRLGAVTPTTPHTAQPTPTIA
jgi:amidase